MTKGERTQMASKGYGNLWIMAIGLIGIFVLATVVAPEFISHGNAGSGMVGTPTCLRERRSSMPPPLPYRVLA